MKKRMLVKQHDSTDCGAACLASICRYYGKDMAITQIRLLAGTGKNGTNIYGLIEASEKLEFDAKGVRCYMEDLPSVPLPAIVHVTLDENYDHFVVLVSMSSKEFVLMDPAAGKFVRLSVSQLKKIWTGAMVLIRPKEIFTKYNARSVMQRLTGLAYPHRSVLLQACAGTLLVSLLGLLPSVYIQNIIDNILPSGNTHLLAVLSIAMIIAVSAQVLLDLVKDLLSAQTAQQVNLQLMLAYHRHIFQLPQRFFDSMKTGELISRVNDGTRISTFINEVITGFTVNSLILFFSLALMFVYYWKMALIVLLILPLYLVLFYVNDRLSCKWQRNLMTSGAALESQMVENLSAASTVKKNLLEDYINEKTSSGIISFMKKLYYSGVQSAAVQSAADYSTKLFTVIVLWAGSYYVMEGRLSPGELLSFHTLLAHFTMPVMYLLNAGRQVREAAIAAERLFEIMDLEQEKGGEIKLPLNEPVHLRLDRVKYISPRGEVVLEDINADIPVGMITGLTGRTGSGKSTLAAILQNIYQPTEGRILVNGIRMDYIELAGIRRAVQCVTQHPELLSVSIIENIVADAGPPDTKRLFRICDELGITSFAESMPFGLNTVLTEQGKNLSGGQKQLICLARALYRQPAVLILDEATSALDSQSEEQALKCISNYCNKERSIIIIAHRQSALTICNRILRIENGVLR